MKTAILERPGQLDSIRFTQGPETIMGAKQVEIEVEAAALNFKDVLLALGLMPSANPLNPGLGFECVGVIRRVGAEVRGFAVGDPVVAIGGGCLSTTVCVDAANVCHKPRRLTAQEAVTMPIAFVTASYALEEMARIRKTDRILIHAATGGVGLAAVQLAQHMGAEVMATAGSDEKRAYLRSLGIRHVMNSRTTDFAQEILDVTDGKGVDVILNSLSGDLMERSLDLLAPHGRFVELGARDAIAGHSVALSAFRRGGSFCSVGYEGPIPGLGERLADIMARTARGECRPLPARAFAINQVSEAFSFLASAKHIGKVTVIVKPGHGELLSPKEGGRVFELCLSGGRANFLVSKTPLANRLAKAAAVQVIEVPKEAARLHPRPALAVAFVAPRTSVEGKIAAVWQRHFSLEAIGMDDDFFDLGGDSLLAVQVAHSMREALGVDVPAHLILENPTIGEVAPHLEDKKKPQGSRHLVQLAKGPAEARPIFLVHPIGGHVYFYLPLAKRLAATAPVFGLQAQGVDGEAAPLATIEEMAERYIGAIRTVQPHGPYRIGGSSFGGTVSFEMARQLTAAGEKLELLALIDSPTPSSLTAFAFRSDAEILSYVLARGESPEEHLRQLSAMQDEDQMLRYFLVHGGAGGELDASATVASVRHFLHLFRANYDALVRYRLERCPVRGQFFYASDHDSFNTAGFAQEWASSFAQIDFVGVPGNHISMNLPPNYEPIIEGIMTALLATGATK